MLASLAKAMLVLTCLCGQGMWPVLIVFDQVPCLPMMPMMDPSHLFPQSTYPVKNRALVSYDLESSIQYPLYLPRQKKWLPGLPEMSFLVAHRAPPRQYGPIKQHILSYIYDKTSSLFHIRTWLSSAIKCPSSSKYSLSESDGSIAKSLSSAVPGVVSFSSNGPNLSQSRNEPG